MSWAAVAGAGVAAVGGIVAANKSKKGGSTTSDPWAAQQPYLKDSFQGAQDAYKGAMAQGPYTGPRVAGLDPYQTAGARAGGDYAANYGMPAAQQLTQAGQGFLGSGGQFSGNAADLYGRATANSQPTILSNAAAYANNPYVDGLINSANRDVSRNLNETALPSLARAASGTGNTNSSRAGVESAILQRGAADRMADTASNIRSQFFGKGLDMSQQQYNQDLDNSLRANNGLLQSFQQGGNTILQGQQAAGNSYDMSQAAGNVFSGHDQANLNADQAAFNERANYGLDMAGKYQGIINGNYGGTTSQTNPTNPWGAAIGGGLAGYGTFGKLGGYTQTPVTDYGGGLNSGNGYVGAGGNAYPNFDLGGTNRGSGD